MHVKHTRARFCASAEGGSLQITERRFLGGVAAESKLAVDACQTHTRTLLMPIERGAPWGGPGGLPEDGVVVRDDAQLRQIVEVERRAGRPLPAFGLLGGDLCRTLGGRGDEARLRSPDATRVTVDLGAVLLDGRLCWFVAHLVVRTVTWSHVFVAMNAQWYGKWNLGPRAHPGDGLLDTYEASLPLTERLKVRARLRHGTHVPHPGIQHRRLSAVQADFERPLGVRMDGEACGRVQTLSARVEPDALTVVV
jgi:hypothetical protein